MPNLTFPQLKGGVATLSSSVGEKLYFAGESMNINGNTIAVHGASESVYLMLDKMLGNDH